MVEITPAQAGDAEGVAANLREQDRAELAALGHTDFAHVIRSSIALSTLAWTTRIDGELVCVGGVAPIGSVLDPRGACWMLGTPLVAKHRRILAREAPRYISKMLEAYPHLLNQVHANNTVATRWLRKMGFVLQRPTPVPPYGELFHYFEMRRDV